MSPPALERDARALLDAMTELLRVYQFRDRDRLGYHGLTITQSYAMEVIVRLGPITLNDLAREMNLDKSTMSRVVDGLERKRAIVRRENPSDGRSTLIEATHSGRERRRLIEEDLVAENARVLSSFAPPARVQAVELVRALTNAARQRRLEDVGGDET
ncbi:MAG TPA: MarR family transcriptional regulator [Gemmatimonadaceae bacterium]|nr:MarR family transcriptional regulator [Gemmatimonadaceae bacterium]